MNADNPVALAIARIAEISEAVGWQADVGGSETAGQIISYLAAHPEQIETLLQGGILALPLDWFENGKLTWQAMNGRIMHPRDARLARTVPVGSA